MSAILDTPEVLLCVRDRPDGCHCTPERRGVTIARMFTKAIVRPPAPNFAEGLTTAGLGTPEYERALEQHDAYCTALEHCGLTLIRLEADANYPDSCFVEDTTVVIRSLTENTNGGVRAPNRQAVLTRPGAPSRQGEVETIRAALSELLPPEGLKQIEPPGTLDGGDVCEAGNNFFIGISQRTNEAGARQLADAVAEHDYTSSLIDFRGTEDLLHLKSGLAYLGDNRLVVSEAFAGRKEFAGFDLIQVPGGEEYAANCLKVNDYVLVAAGYPHFERTLRELGYQTIELEMSEFQKMDGGLSCLSLRW